MQGTQCLLAVCACVGFPLAIGGIPLPSNHQFRRNAGGRVYHGPALWWKASRSPLECLKLCSGWDQCEAVNVCDLDHDGDEVKVKVNCTLLDDADSGLRPNAQASCFSVEKTSRIREPINCQNGGTVTQAGTACICHAQYDGRQCERYIRDCTEPFKRGYNSSDSGIYWIQPIGTPSPFYVQCIFEWGGATIAYKWSTMSAALSWSMMKTGYGTILLKTDPNHGDYFIGLDNLHYLTAQANWHLNVVMSSGSVWSMAFYEPFAVGPEGSRYNLSAPNFSPSGSTPPDNGFAGQSPMLFSTWDHDLNNCAVTHGAGWYGPDCSTGHSVFSTLPTWPVGGQTKFLTSAQFIMVRTSDYDM